MNKKITTYINNLLFDNDCVIIPNLGGFVASYKSAEIHPIKHQFLPPSKRVAFNEKLQLNDGLLISNIANLEEISLIKASELVSQFVADVTEKLRNKETIQFEKIGKLFKNQEGRLQFKADVKDNHLDDSFGLPEFFATPILRDSKNIKLRNKFKDRIAMSTEEKQADQAESKNKKNGGAGVWVLGVIALLLTVSTIYLFIFDNGDKVNQLSSMLPFFGNSNTVQNTPTDTSLIEVEDSIDEEEITFDEEEIIEDENIDYSEPEEIVEQENTEINFEPSIRESNNTEENFLNELTGRYYVIAGAFSSQENAENLRNELIGKGFNAKVLSPKGKKPLFRVSLEDYENSNEGNDRVLSENSNFENALWLMKY